jgi:hypothetical protein
MNEKSGSVPKNRRFHVSPGVPGPPELNPNVSVLPQSPRRPQRETRYSLGIQEQQIFRVGTHFSSLPEERTHRVWLCDLGDLCGEKSRLRRASDRSAVLLLPGAAARWKVRAESSS